MARYKDLTAESMFDKNKALEYYQQELSITAAAKKHCKDLGIPYEEKYRHRLSKFINSDKVDRDLENGTTTKTNQYSNDNEKDEGSLNMPSAWDQDLNRFLSIEEYCDTFGLDKETVQSSKLVSHNMGHMVYNIAFKRTIATASGIDEDFIEEIVKQHIQPVSIKRLDTTGKLSNANFFDRCVMTDIHLNMDPTGEINTVAMYDHKWGEKEVFERLDRTIEHIMQHKKGDVLYIDELGDLMDGLQGHTTRGGHHLPQVGSDKDAFKLGIDFKMYLIDRLVKIYGKVVLNNITNDNHSFLFGFFVNQAVKRIVKVKYPDNVEYNVIERFIDHYSVGKHTFILSHGKDSGEKKFGFKATYDPKAADVIDNYCKSHKLYNGNSIEFSMGDQHQRIFDTTSNNDFDYHAYGAFSPPSNWVSTNFKDTPSSVDFFNIHKEKNLKINIPLIF